MERRSNCCSRSRHFIYACSSWILLGLHNNFLSSVPDTNEDRNSSLVGDSKGFGNHNRLEQNQNEPPDKVNVLLSKFFNTHRL
ncbi:hypothetical protein ACHQM5_019888 [Ranunculus cassubicifolius]